MSTTQLAPAVSKTLNHFARRKFLLQSIRAVCVLLTALIPAMAIVAFIDWGWIVSDSVRWILSTVAYAGSAGLTWWLSGRHLFRRPTQSELATQLESTDPVLRQQLRSAVELSTETPDEVPDSATFRSLLQKQVGEQIQGVKVSRSLPLSLMKRWGSAAVVVVAAVALVLLVGGARMRRLAVRAMLPMANVDRVSRIQVEILQPTPQSQMIPMEETVAVVVATRGGEVNEAVLEVWAGDQEPQKIVMRRRTEGEFAANLHVDAQQIDYRILAGDAVTRRHTIQGRYRPRVATFEKTYHFPEYSRLKDEHRSEQDGDVVALSGTRVELALKLTQPVSVAELRVAGRDDEERQIVPLQQQSDGTWTASVDVEQQALYQVYLVSSETQFDNPFSPRYEIRPIPDLVPRAGFVDQPDTQLLLPPNDILALKGMAEDDLPLNELSQEVSINGAPWTAVPLSTQQVANNLPKQPLTDEPVWHRIQSDWNWDLMGLRLETGDHVTTRLVAVDRRGNRGESVPLSVIVSAPDFDPERHSIMQRRTAFVRRIDRFARTIDTQRERAIEILDRLRDAAQRSGDNDQPTADFRLDVETLRESANHLEDAGIQLIEDAASLIADLPAGNETYELDLVGRSVATICYDHVSQIRYGTAELLQESEGRKQRPLLNEIRGRFDRARDDARSLATGYQHFASADLFNALALDMLAIQKQQKLVVDSPTQTFERLQRQETVVLNQLRNVARLAESERLNAPDFLAHHFDQLIDWAGLWETRLEDAMESEDRLPELKRHIRDLAREIGDRQRYDVIDGGLPGRLVQYRMDIDNRAGTLTTPLAELATAVTEEVERHRRASDAKDSDSATQHESEAQSFARKADLRAVASLEQLKTRRRLCQARLDSDRQFAADAGLAHRAVSSVLSSFRSTDPRETVAPRALHDIARAYRVLEAGHDFANVERLLNTLEQSERWQALQPEGRLANPNRWEAITAGIDQGLRKLQPLRLDGKVMNAYQQIRWTPTVANIDRKIKERRWQHNNIVSASSDVLKFQQQLIEAHKPLHAAMAEARAVIARYAPTIPELAREIAADIRQMEEATTSTADSFEDAGTTPQQERQQVAELQKQQQHVNEDLEMLLDALVEDANQQDVNEAEERERARDADTGIAMVEHDASQMNQQLEEAARAASRKETARQLSLAAEQQEHTAGTLDQLAEHFERLETGEDIALSRDELRQAERDLGIARQLDQQFTPVTQPAETPSRQSQIEQLEEELRRNPAMQQALSEISKNTIEEARNALIDAAEQEQRIQTANERSDQQLQQDKNDLQKDLKELGRKASHLARTMVQEAGSAASRGGSQPAEDAFNRARQQLTQAASTANSASNGDLAQDLQQKTEDIKSALDEAANALSKGQQAADDARSNRIADTPRRQQELKRDAENQQKRFADQLRREADQEVRRRDNAERQEASNVRNAERNEKAFQQQLQRAEQQVEKNPDNQGAKNQVRRLQQQLKQAQDQTETIRQRQKKAQQAEEQARQDRAALNQFPKGNLDDDNPAAQLAERLAEQATQRNEELRQTAKELAERIQNAPSAAATAQQLADAAKSQNEIRNDVQETAQQLERAARHESRLNNEDASSQLTQQAEAVDQVAQQEASDAGRKLNEAATAVAEAKAISANEPEGSPQTAQQQTKRANTALQNAETALLQQAESLDQAISRQADEAASDGEQGSKPSGDQSSGQNNGDTAETTQSGANQSNQRQPNQNSSTEPPGSPPPTSGAAGESDQAPFTPEQSAQGRQLAQMLDELDRLQANSPQANSQQGTPTPGQMTAAASMAQQRSLRQQQSQPSQSNNGFNDQNMPDAFGADPAFRLTDVDRSSKENWGQLRERDAEKVVNGRRTAVSEEYRRSVEAYFKVLAERSRRRESLGN